MANSVYKMIEIVGTSSKSWEDAAKFALETAQGTLKDLRIAEVLSQDIKLEGKTVTYRTRLRVSFKYQK